MDREPLQAMMRKRVIDLKTDMPGFYTETYNIVSTLVRLTPPDNSLVELVQEKIGWIYSQPSAKHKMSLAHFEDLYWKYKGDPTFKVRHSKLDIYEIKRVLDKVRRDLLFYLAVIESPEQNYGIVSGEIKKVDADAVPSPASPPGQPGGMEQHQEDAGKGE